MYNLAALARFHGTYGTWFNIADPVPRLDVTSCTSWGTHPREQHEHTGPAFHNFDTLSADNDIFAGATSDDGTENVQRRAHLPWEDQSKLVTFVNAPQGSLRSAPPLSQIITLSQNSMSSESTECDGPHACSAPLPLWKARIVEEQRDFLDDLGKELALADPLPRPPRLRPADAAFPATAAAP